MAVTAPEYPASAVHPDGTPLENPVATAGEELVGQSTAAQHATVSNQIEQAARRAQTHPNGQGGMATRWIDIVIHPSRTCDGTVVESAG